MSTTTSDIFGVKIEKNPPPSKLAHLGVTSWPKVVPVSVDPEEGIKYYGKQIKCELQCSTRDSRSESKYRIRYFSCELCACGLGTSSSTYCGYNDSGH
ncbi:hypothetical protein Ddye_004943 [Dipteronia dyeriana]|uniref:Uncharacterized protein n=1 Tax=Dipteronia dyeriana TaxID=168575 RepID=A0AAD9XF68_9ROSI|nr:hypothetical protein Ddye_004943 [Dipteronia dyeriana]